MDIARPELSRKRRRRRVLLGITAIVVLGAITTGLSRLKPAAPVVEGTSIWTDTVKRGPMLLEVRGNGTLVPERIQFVQSETEGRVERILVQPGAQVGPDTVLMELSNAELKQAAFDAEYQLKAGEAQRKKLEVQLESERLTQKASLATLKSDTEQAELMAQADETLSGFKLVPLLAAKQSRAKANDLKGRVAIEEERGTIVKESARAQLAAADADLEKVRALLALKQRQVAAQAVRAGIDGVLQQIGDTQPLQIGQRVSPSATLAKIVQPARLKAQIRIGETQARDILLGQTAFIDTRNGIVPGKVTRVDPAVQNGTVTVDVSLEGELPRGARPDLSVDGNIELARLDDVLHVGRPVQGRAESVISLFKVIDGGRNAVRVPVKVGRASANAIEILQGLEAGDTVILSDMSAWERHEKVRLD